MRIRIATYNVQNLYSRPLVLELPGFSKKARGILDDVAELGGLLERPSYEGRVGDPTRRASYASECYEGAVTLRDSYPAYELCPCDSGAKAKFCCWRGRSWIKPAAVIKPPPPATGLAAGGCYASRYKDCDLKMSGEHYVSRVILKEVALNDTIKIAGLRWQQPEAFSVYGIDSLVTKVLCKRHNTALGPLDKEASRLWKTIRAFELDLRTARPTDAIKVIAGADIERWLLKSTIALVQVGSGRSLAREECVPILYDEMDWPEGWGLYFQAGLGAQLYHSSSLEFRTLIDPASHRVLAAQFILCGMPFTLLLGKPDMPSAFGTRRPRTLIMSAKGADKFIEFCWNDVRCDRFVRLTREGSYDGDPPDWPEWARNRTGVGATPTS